MLYLAFCLIAHADAPPTWPQWRGPTRDGVVRGAPWPAGLKHLERQWRVELAEGYPGPIVTDKHVFVAETKGRKDEVVRCLDRATGKQVWEFSWAGAMTVPFFALSNGSWVRSTPAHDGECLYVAGMRDVLVCLDAATGKQRWRADLMARYKAPLPAFGFVCSPLVDGDAVYVQAAASLLKLNKKTGETIWRSMKDGGGMYGSAFSSPVLATLAGKRQLVVQTRTTLAGVDPDSGKELWSVKVPATRGMNILTPTVYKDAVFTSAYGAKTYLFRVKRDGEKWSVSEAWSIRMEGYMSSPAVVGKHAYLHLRNQRLACIDLEAGKVKWTTARSFGQYWSLAVQGDRVLALDQKGILYLVRANPEKFDLIDQAPVSKQPTWGHVAVCGDEVFVRELKGLVKFRWK